MNLLRTNDKNTNFLIYNIQIIVTTDQLLILYHLKQCNSIIYVTSKILRILLFFKITAILSYLKSIYSIIFVQFLQIKNKYSSKQLTNNKIIKFLFNHEFLITIFILLQFIDFTYIVYTISNSIFSYKINHQPFKCVEIFITEDFISQDNKIKMGNCCQIDLTNNCNKTITVATLNYSGLLNSPFQFYSDQKNLDEKKLSTSFRQLFKQRISDQPLNSYTWNIGSIDKKLQQNRYTPLYNKTAGIVDGRLCTQSEFLSQWDKIFDDEKIKLKLSYQQQHRSTMKKFDLICYLSILAFLYDSQQFQKVHEWDYKKYQQYLQQQFAKPYLCDDKKAQILINCLRNQYIQVMFIQQADQFLLDQLDEFHDIFYIRQEHNKQSIILIRKTLLANGQIGRGKNQFRKLTEQQKIALNWNKDSTILFLDKMILISGHLTAKKKQSPNQCMQMFNSLENLNKKYPGYVIVAGMDANTQKLPNFNNSKEIYMFPATENSYTTCKKRTWMQVQNTKAEQVNQVNKDYIVTNRKIKQAKICQINGVPIDTNQIKLIPNNNHPFDHYLVISKIYMEDPNDTIQAPSFAEVPTASRTDI